MLQCYYATISVQLQKSPAYLVDTSAEKHTTWVPKTLLSSDSNEIVTSNSYSTGCEMADIVNVRGDITWNFVTLKYNFI